MEIEEIIARVLLVVTVILFIVGTILLGVMAYDMIVSSNITNGLVTGKEYVEAHTSIVPMRSGSVTVMVPREVEEDWTITVKNNNKEYTVSITEDEYNNIQIGDYWEKQ